MKLNYIEKILFTITIILATAFVAYSQPPYGTQNGKSFELEASLNSTTTYSYNAREFIKLLPGFSVKPNTGYSFSAAIDKTVFCDPEYVTISPRDPSPLTRPLGSGEVGTLPRTFSVSPTGSAVYHIPIEVPKGVNGMSPTLAVVYNSQAGNGIMGIGWSLNGLSSINRTGRTIYYDGAVSGMSTSNADSRLVLDGQRLISISSTPGIDGTQFRPENESFLLVTKQTSGQKIWFIAETRDGRTLTYGSGTEDDGQLYITGTSTVLTWMLKSVTDKHGNYIKYYYNNSSSLGQITIKQIEYSGGNLIQFGYNKRSDVWNGAVLDGKISQNYLLAQINIFNAGKTITKYSFNYTLQDGSSTLYEIEKENSDGKTLNSTAFEWSLPHFNTTETYTGDRVAGGDGFEVGDFTGDGMADVLSITGYTCKLNTGSSNGIVAGASTFKFPHSYFYHNVGSYITSSDLNCWGNESPGRVNIEDLDDIERVLTGDFNGDGVLEIMVFNKEYQVSNMEGFCNDAGPHPPLDILNLLKRGFLTVSGHRCRVYSIGASGLTQKANFMVTNYPSLDVANTVDFNQDGKMDIAYDGKVYTLNSSGSSLNCIGTTSHVANFLKAMWCDINGDGFADFIKGNTIYRRANLLSDYSTFLNFAAGESPLGIIDGNGDGQSEVIVLGAEEYELVEKRNPVTGERIINPDTGEPVMENVFRGRKLQIRKYANVVVKDFGYLTANYPTRATTCDINADGQADFALFNDVKLIGIYYSSGSKYFKIPLNIQVDYCAFAGDFDGDGIDEIVSTGSNGIKFASGTPGKKITGIIDGLNRKTSITYKPLTSTSVYTRSQTNSYPVVNLSGPLSVVYKVESTNGVNSVSTVYYAYEDGKIHLQGKGFLGFARITRNNTTTSQVNVSASEFDPTYFTVKKQTEYTFRGGKQVSEVITDYQIIPNVDKRIFLYPIQIESKDLLRKVTVKTVNSYTSAPYYNLTNQKTTYSTTYNSDESSEEKIYDLHNAYGYPGIITTKLNRKSGGTTEAEIIRTQTFDYNPDGTVHQKVANELTTTYEYDSFGNVTSEQVAGAEGSRTYKTSYEPSGRFVKTLTNPLNQVTSDITSDIRGNPVVVKDINGNQTTSTFNGWNQLVATSTPNGHQITQGVAWAGGDDKPIDALYYTYLYRDGLLESSEYFDILGRSIRKVTVGYKGAKFYTDTKYNEKGQVVEQTEPYSAGGTVKKTSFTYNDDGTVNIQTLPSLVTVTFGYSNCTVTQTYSTGEIFTKTYDAAGLMINSTDPGGTITFAYQSDGRNYRTTAPGGTTTMEYDDLGRQTSLTDPDAGKTKYKLYSAFGELTQQEDARGKLTKTTYDALGRVKTIDVDGDVTTYNYDDPGYLGLLKSISGTNSGTITYTYDKLGRVTSECRAKGGDSFTYSYEHDSKGRISRMTYPSGFAITYAYTSHDDLEMVYDAANPSTPIWRIDNVDIKSRIQNATYGNGKQITYSYDNNDKLSRIFVPGVIDFNYWFNSKDQLDWRKELYYETQAWLGFQEDFKYDNVNRLETAKIGGNTIYSTSYKSGVNDRFEAKSDVGSYTYVPMSHRVQQVAPVASYSPPQHDLTYTARGRVATITEGTKVTTFEYGVDDQRFKTVYTQGGVVQYSRFYFNDYEKEVNGDGTLRREISYIYAGGRLVAIHEKKPTGSALHYVYTDYLGSLRCITDASGNVEQKLSFDAWGNRRNPITGVRYATTPTGLLFARGFTGHEHLDEVGLINMNARIYDPMLGMFVSPDNYVFNPSNSQNYNRYTYCLNNPLMYTDPSGFNEQAYEGCDGYGWGNSGFSSLFTTNDNFNYGRPCYTSTFSSSLNMLLKSSCGGSWSSLYGVYFYSSQDEAYADGAAYNDYHNSWKYTYYKSAEKSMTAYLIIKSKPYIKELIGSIINYNQLPSINTNTWLACLGDPPSGGGGDNWADATLAFIAADVAVPEPTDAVWLKWAAYGVAATVATVYLYERIGGKDGFHTSIGTPFNYVSPQPDNQNDYRNNGDRPGLWLGIGIGTIMGIDLVRDWYERTTPTPIAPTTINKDTTTIIIPYRPGYIPR